MTKATRERMTASVSERVLYGCGPSEKNKVGVLAVRCCVTIFGAFLLFRSWGHHLTFKTHITISFSIHQTSFACLATPTARKTTAVPPASPAQNNRDHTKSSSRQQERQDSTKE